MVRVNPLCEDLNGRIILKCLFVADSPMRTQAIVLRVELEEIREIFKMMEMMICIVKSCVL
jgi:hypothetical protein